MSQWKRDISRIRSIVRFVSTKVLRILVTLMRAIANA
jgi:hypothetical protein